ncbi:MAG: EAL domain-containing protein [Eubacteriales bacterium]|nr:EAL domain-containing protein [Eubacteriales bacterium]
MSIKKSLQSSILLIAVIPVILMAFLAYIIVTTKSGQIAKENCKTITLDYSYGFSSQLEAQATELAAIGDTIDVKSLLLEKINSPDTLLNASSPHYTAVRDTLIYISNTLDNNVNYYLYDIDGYLVVASCADSVSDWTEVMETNLDNYTDSTIIPNSRFNENSIDIIRPVIVKDTIVGLIRANISADCFGAFLSKNNNCFILDEQLHPLFGYDTSSKDDQRFLKHITTTQQTAKRQNKNISSDTFSERTEHIYGYAYLSQYHWIYVTKKNISTYSAIVSRLPITLCILLVGVITFSILLSNYLANKYTMPIMELSANMQKAADGDLNVNCDVTTKDEFGTLFTNFNHMMDIISTNYDKLSDAQSALKHSQTELQNNYENMERLAYTDALTGLYNRMAFFKFAPEILSGATGSLSTHAVIFIDLDGFKSINDTLGHDYGDLLLQAVSAKLTGYIASDDILARNGGDEFVILRNKVPSKDDLEEFLKTLVSIATSPFVLDDETVHITLSVGAAIFPQNGLSLNELMKNADIAMYTSKTSGKNSYTFFSSAMEDEVNRRNDLIDVLRDAIPKKDVYLLYQPQANISTGEIIGCEALMRLNSSILGFVSPEEFIPVAEESGMINELGEWALVEACNFNQHLIESGFKPIKISVNVSTSQLRGDRLIRAIESLHEKTSMPLQYLELELTESVLMKNFDHNLSLIRRMKELGIQIALDDFGTGYSSFSYLTQLPIDTLKIDKSFIAGICDDEDAKYISSTIIALAHQLHITVVAEGIETIDQLKILQGQSCDILQGYFFSKPLPQKEFVELLRINS